MGWRCKSLQYCGRILTNILDGWNICVNRCVSRSWPYGAQKLMGVLHDVMCLTAVNLAVMVYIFPYGGASSYYSMSADDVRIDKRFYSERNMSVADVAVHFQEK